MKWMHQRAGASVCWHVGVLAHQCVGTSACWCVGVLTRRCVGTSVLACRCVGASVCWRIGVLARQCVLVRVCRHVGASTLAGVFEGVTWRQIIKSARELRDRILMLSGPANAMSRGKSVGHDDIWLVILLPILGITSNVVILARKITMLLMKRESQ